MFLWFYLGWFGTPIIIAVLTQILSWDGFAIMHELRNDPEVTESSKEN
jgi:heme/copper-type cytochrome/quinol oxidase subunit 2